MQLTPMKELSLAEMTAFEDECFRDWLNIVDAKIGYDARRRSGDVKKWRALFDAGECEKGAIACLHWE